MAAIDPKYGKQALKNSMEMINKGRHRKEVTVIEQTTDRTKKIQKRSKKSQVSQHHPFGHQIVVWRAAWVRDG